MARAAFLRPGLTGSEERKADDISATFECLRAQGEVKRILGETPGEKLDERLSSASGPVCRA